jgi:hypothetical protein
MLSLYTSSVTHEMITPLKCVKAFGKSIINNKDEPSKISKDAQLIVTTS